MSSYHAQTADYQYWRDQIKCQAACPVHTDARGYIRAIAEGDSQSAYLIARGPNPLASICGRVCAAPCEAACRRGELDKPVAIRALKRFICEQHGPESGIAEGKAMVEMLREAAQRGISHDCEDQEELLPLLQRLTQGKIKKVEGRSVGIIGSGPAGLAAAHDLALLGFRVTIYEMEPVLAGMLAVGVPEYRLPRSVIQGEVEVIRALGVKAVTNCRVGRDVGFAELRARHDAVVVAVGAKQSRALALPGGDAEGVIGGVEFLRDVSLRRSVSIGRRVVVIGGGNVAYDVGRSVLRQIALDAARTAKREAGVHEVYLCSLESLDEMPADDIEIIEGDEEGIIRRNSLGLKEIVKDAQGKVQAVRFKRCLRVFDENRRFSPQYAEEDITEIPCDNVLIAIGQSYNLEFIDAERDAIKMTERGAIACDPVSGRTSAPDVFVAGDLAYGPKLLIHGVASGKSVARAIYEQVTGVALRSDALHLHFPIPDYGREKDYEKQRRLAPSTLPVKDRLSGAEVERCYTAEQASCEAGRCLNCGINTIFDGERCILCGGCVDVCPQECLRIVSLDQLDLPGEGANAVGARLEERSPESSSAILKDETICIRCGLCAERCPVGAITMEQFHFEERPQCLDA